MPGQKILTNLFKDLKYISMKDKFEKHSSTAF